MRFHRRMSRWWECVAGVSRTSRNASSRPIEFAALAGGFSYLDSKFSFVK